MTNVENYLIFNSTPPCSEAEYLPTSAVVFASIPQISPSWDNCFVTYQEALIPSNRYPLFTPLTNGLNRLKLECTHCHQEMTILWLWFVFLQLVRPQNYPVDGESKAMKSSQLRTGWIVSVLLCCLLKQFPTLCGLHTLQVCLDDQMCWFMGESKNHGFSSSVLILNVFSTYLVCDSWFFFGQIKSSFGLT